MELHKTVRASTSTSQNTHNNGLQSQIMRGNQYGFVGVLGWVLPHPHFVPADKYITLNMTPNISLGAWQEFDCRLWKASQLHSQDNTCISYHYLMAWGFPSIRHTFFRRSIYSIRNFTILGSTLKSPYLGTLPYICI